MFPLVHVPYKTRAKLRQRSRDACRQGSNDFSDSRWQKFSKIADIQVLTYVVINAIVASCFYLVWAVFCVFAHGHIPKIRKEDFYLIPEGEISIYPGDIA